jgi:hypothetical protein
MMPEWLFRDRIHSRGHNIQGFREVNKDRLDKMVN